LGLDDASAFDDAQTNRVDGLLVQVSRQFRREAEREFTPGTTTVRLLTVAGRVRLSEPISEVVTVAARDCYGEPVDVDHTLDGQELLIHYPGGHLYPSGVVATVTYTHEEEVPEDVVAAVAGIVARHLSVDSAAAQVVSETAGPYATRYANWVSDTSLLTEAECCTARSYRHPASTIIIQRP
jgi:hypothetical protein